jgi:hypothetical protein
MGTDFFDEDLAREREDALKIKLDGESGGAPRDGVIPSSRDLPNRPVSSLPLTHLARHKQEVNEQMVDKSAELDRLRARQEELEEERRMLEEMREKQEAFDRDRRDLKERLGSGLVRMEKDQLQAERLVELLEETRRIFHLRQEEVSALNEEQWQDEALLEELNKALVLLENVRSDYNKAMAKIDAVRPHADTDGESLTSLAAFEQAAAPAAAAGQSFGYWLRAGLAFTLPLMTLLSLLVVIWMMFSYYWG